MDRELIKKRLIADLEEGADKEIAEKNLTFHKNRGFTMYGLPTVELRKIMKQYKADFLSLSLPERLDLVQDLLSLYNEELSHVAVCFLNLSVSRITPEEFSRIEGYTELLINWSMVDDYGLNVIQPLLVRYPQEILCLLRKWSLSQNPWQRRLSMIAFVRKTGASGRFTEEFLEICDNLVWDQEDLVRKGVGWALKDSMRGNKERVLEYIKMLRKKGVSSTIILYAIRDIKDPQERDRVLKHR